MSNDPIVEEIRRARAKLLDDCEGDLDKLLDRYKASEEQDQTNVVTPAEVRQRQASTSHRHPTGG